MKCTGAEGGVDAAAVDGGSDHQNFSHGFGAAKNHGSNKEILK